MALIDMTVLLGSWRNVTRQPLLEPEHDMHGKRENLGSAVNSFAMTGGRLLPEALPRLLHNVLVASIILVPSQPNHLKYQCDKFIPARLLNWGGSTKVMDLFFDAFLRNRASDLRRISRASKNQITASELQSEAWLIAYYIGAKRGIEVDFSDPDEQEVILGQLYNTHVKRADWKLYRAARMDQDEDNDRPSWKYDITASATSDPFLMHLQSEAIVAEDVKLAESFSQAAAYVIVFRHFGSHEAVCLFLVISRAVLANREDFAIASVKVQPSLFDRIERISENFIPLPGKLYLKKEEETHPDWLQQAFPCFAGSAYSTQ